LKGNSSLYTVISFHLKLTLENATSSNVTAIYTSYCSLKIMTERPSLDEYFLEIAFVVEKRSTCLRNNVGAVVVRDKRILSTGYNGAPSGMEHCLEIGCIRTWRRSLQVLNRRNVGQCMRNRMPSFRLQFMG